MQTDREEFLRRRRTGIGGSDVGALLGVDRFRDSLDVFRDKVLPQEDDEDFANQGHILAGNYIEPVVSQLYIDSSGRKVRQAKFRRHRKHKFLIGHPDRIIVALDRPPYQEPRDAAGCLECKVVNRWTMERIEREGVPQSHVLQLNHYMGCCNVPWGALAILCPDPVKWKFVTFEMDFDEALFEAVAAEAGRFWREHVVKKLPPLPKPMELVDAPELSKDESIQIMSGNLEWAEAVKYFREAKEIEASGKAAVELAKDLLVQLMPEEGVYEGAGSRVYYKTQAGRKTFDRKSLEAMQPIDPIVMATLLREAGLELDQIELLFEASRLNITRFEKRGKPFRSIRHYEAKV